MKAIITLGCEGYQDQGFIFCPKVENKLIDLEKIVGSKNYFQVIQYLDSVAKIFDGPCNNLNIITNVMYKLYTLEYLTEKQYYDLAYFYNMHRKCGLILESKLK